MIRMEKKSCVVRLRRHGFTLLELLLAFSLAILIFGMIWELLRLYSGHYYLAERKVAHSQLIRSLAELLDDDLMSAIQDPIMPLAPFQVGQSRFVRRFGLRGNATSLQIDVVEPDPQTTFADAEENRRYTTGMSTIKGIQVPELKTIIYTFVSPGALEETQDVSSDVSGGTALVGSLSSPGEMNSDSGEMNSDSREQFGTLARRYGLSRQELDFETPTPSEEQKENADPTGGSEFVGSLAAPPEASQSQLHADSPLDTPAADQNTQSVLTAVQLASYTEDHTRWAPEVVELQFRYFDGTHWLDSWNSLEKNGLPLAIEVQLKLMPLDEIDTLRSSPLYLEFLRRHRGSQTDESGSRMVGSLQTLPTPTTTLEPLSLENGDIPSDLNGQTQPAPPQTFEEVIDRLGLTASLDRRVVSWLPTTPLARHQTLKRRLPVPDTDGSYTLGATRRPRVVPPQRRDDTIPAGRVVREREPVEREPSDFDMIDLAKRDFQTTAPVQTQRAPDELPVNMSAPPQSQTARTSSAGGWLRGERKTQK